MAKKNTVLDRLKPIYIVPRTIITNSYSYLKSKTQTESYRDLVDSFKFILLHGILGMFVLILIVSLLGTGFNVVDNVRKSQIWTILVFLLGSGASYYFFLDINKFLRETWGRNK